MRPKFSAWSDYPAPAQRHWMLASKRGTGTSVGPKILLAAVVVVAGVIGISGIDPQVIDLEWVQDSLTLLPKTSLSAATTKRSGIVAAIPLPPRRALTTGEASQLRTTIATLEQLAETATPPGVAEISDAQANADALPAPAGSAKMADKSRAALVAKKAVVVRKKAARVERRQRSQSEAYVQNGGRGWPNGGWTGYSPFGNFRSF
jgi:hypothetical protein